MAICPRCAASFAVDAGICPHCGGGASATQETKPDEKATPADGPQNTPPRLMHEVTLGDESRTTRAGRIIGLFLGISGGFLLGACLLAGAFMGSTALGSSGALFMNGCFVLVFGPILGGIGGAVLGWAFAHTAQVLGRTARYLMDPKARAAAGRPSKCPRRRRRRTTMLRTGFPTRLSMTPCPHPKERWTIVSPGIPQRNSGAMKASREQDGLEQSTSRDRKAAKGAPFRSRLVKVAETSVTSSRPPAEPPAPPSAPPRRARPSAPPPGTRSWRPPCG